jgi:hypothetical protein
MNDVEAIKNNIREVCGLHTLAHVILKKANGKLSYLEISSITRVSPAKCSTILNKANSFNLLEKVKPGIFKRNKIITGGLIDSALKNIQKDISVNEYKIAIRKKKKVINTDKIKREILIYLQNNFYQILHPFSDRKEKHSKESLKKVAEILFNYLKEDLGIFQLDGLELRFYNSFSEFLSSSPINKSEAVAAFSNLIKCFEPYVKKVAAIKNNDPRLAHCSLDEELIKKAISFTSVIKKRDNEYWK